MERNVVDLAPFKMIAVKVMAGEKYDVWVIRELN